ncbi:MAG: NADH:ubiquinone reductase (Na(+)-transporting) subunit B [Bacteroidales bacterium]|nr:NADH:ubiquinone reductase (Na(+)-transporting) subunit B [Bacteroidales bacterium]
MNFVEKFFEQNREKVAKGQKLHWLASTFEAFESFSFVSNKTAKARGAHFRDAIDSKRAIIVVVIALIPALLFGMYNVGWQHFNSLGQVAATGFWEMFWYGFLKVLPMIIVSYVVGLFIEFMFAQIREEEVNEGYLVTGLLIPMIVPPTTPLWQLVLAVIFGTVIGKEVFGGTGMNFMNPALVARAFLFFAYPSQMSGDMVWIYGMPDGVTGATPLGEMLAGAALPSASVCDMICGFIPGSVGETSLIAILIGACILLFTGIASWRIMLSIFCGGAVMGIIFNLIGANAYMQMPFWYHFILGGFAFGAVFMATDPVTAAHTNCGKYIYGFLIGVMAVLIRVVNPAYPEGMMLAILLMNVFAPLIDYYVVNANINRRKKRMVANTK